MSTSEVLELIRKKYAGDEYAMLEEVRNAAGTYANRSADVMVMNLWPSRGLELTGIEVKVSRTDWLKELKSPAKAESFIQYCDRWYLVVGDEKIIMDGELPPTWGLMVVKGKRLVTVKDAPKLTPGHMSKGFVACMLKRATKGLIHPSTIQDKLLESYENGKKQQAAAYARIEQQLFDLRKEVQVFEKASGVSVSRGWENRNNIGEAVKFILNGGAERLRMDLENVKDKATYIKERVDKAFETFKQL